MTRRLRLSAVSSALAIAAALAFSGKALADTVTAEFNNVSPKTTVSYSLKGGAFTGTQAGVFNFSGASGPINMFGASNDMFVSFCIDLRDTVKPNPQNWSVVPLADAPNPKPLNNPGNSMGYTKAGKLAQLLGGTLGTELNNARNTASYNLQDSGFTLNAGQRAAALQVAIWEIVWEDEGKIGSLADDDVRFNLGANNVIRKQAEYWLAGLDGYAAMGHLVGLSSPTVFGGTATQDFVGQVPIPAAAWLFGSAMVGAVALGRRHKEKGEAAAA